MEKIKWNQNGSFQNGQSPTTPSKIKDKQLNNPPGGKTPHGRARGLGKLDRITGQEPHLWEANTCVKWSPSNTAGANFGCHFLEETQRFITFKGIFSDLPIYPIPKMRNKKNISENIQYPSWGKGWTEPAVLRETLEETPSWWWKAGEWHLHEVLEGEFSIEGWKDHRDEVKQTHLSGRSVERGGSVVSPPQNWLHYQETTSTPTSWRTRAASGCWINFRNSLGRFGIISYESSDDSIACSKFKFFRIRYRNNILGTSKNFGLQFDTRERSSNVCSPAAHWVRSLSRDLKCKTASIAFWCLYHLYL